MLAIQIIIMTIGLYLSFYAVYNLFLIFIHFFVPRKNARLTTPATVFKLLIPANNEELLLEKLLRSIQVLDYPIDMYDVLVIADNCTDQTGEIAKQAGFKTVERKDNTFVGKGFALKYGLDNIKNEPYDAVLIVDADSVVEAGSLRELDQAIQQGAKIIQCYNGLSNPNDSWFTRLMDVSRTFGNEVLGPAKEKIKLSSQLMGNGMCFLRDVIDKYGWDSFSVGEDVEYYAKLALHGERIAFVNGARVYHRESVDLEQATPQRLRWSSGRFAVAAKYGIPLLFNGLKSLSYLKIDASLPLILPNPSLGISLTILILIVCLIVSLPIHQTFFAAWFGLLTILQILSFIVGVLYVKERKKKLIAILFAPVFLVWKSGLDLLSVAGVGRKAWVRTERKP